MTETGRAIRAIKLLAILAAASEMYAEDATRRLVVSIPDRKIALIQDGRVVKVYPIAVGKPDTPSPQGSFRITSRIQHPTWYQPGKVVGPGPANPLGTRWIGLSQKGYGIHGTNAPLSIGTAASHGCIRMRNHDVEELFALVQVGDPVQLVSQISPEFTEAFSIGQSESAVSSAIASSTGDAQ